MAENPKTKISLFLLFTWFLRFFFFNFLTTSEFTQLFRIKVIMAEYTSMYICNNSGWQYFHTAEIT